MKITASLLTILLAGSTLALPLAKLNVRNDGLIAGEGSFESDAFGNAAILEKRGPPKKGSSSKGKDKGKKPKASYTDSEGVERHTGDRVPGTDKVYAVSRTYTGHGQPIEMQQMQANAALGGHAPPTVEKVPEAQARAHRKMAGVPQRHEQGQSWPEDIPYASTAAAGGYQNHRGTYPGYEQSQRQQSAVMPTRGMPDGQRVEMRYDTNTQPNTAAGLADRARNDAANRALSPGGNIHPGYNSQTQQYMNWGPPQQPNGHGGWQAMPQQHYAQNSDDSDSDAGYWGPNDHE